MSLLGRKFISPGETRKYTIDYNDWLDTTETLSTMTYAVATGPATVPSNATAGDGKSNSFFVTGASLSYTPFNVTITAVTSAGQTKKDHLEFDVVAA